MPPFGRSPCDIVSHGLGVCVENALNSAEALKASGLDWNVTQRPIMTEDSVPIPGYKANIRDTDNRILGVVSERYRVVQNSEAFAFTDVLLGEGVRYDIREDLKIRYFDAPDLEHVGKNAYRFLCAVSNFATHAKPLHETSKYREGVFSKTIEGNPLIDKAYELALAAV